MVPIINALAEVGPSRTARLVTLLNDSYGMSKQAARQRLSRARAPVERINNLLPKREAFFYLRDQRNSELYWDNLQRDLRESGAIYACAIDGVDARGGIIPIEEFPVVSGAPIALRKQISSDRVAEKLAELDVIGNREIVGLGQCFVAKPDALIRKLSTDHIRARRLTEGVLLDGIRQWAWKNGIGSVNTMTIRGDSQHRMVGQYKWDLCGPSYLLSLRRKSRHKNIRHGFVVADVFAEGEISAPQIRYFVRKVQTYQKTSNSGPLFPILLAERFAGDAMTEGHKIGLMLTTPENLFGSQVAHALADLMRILKNVSAIASVSENDLYRLVGRLTEIEGRAGNMRGILFEMITAYIARRKFGGRVELGVHHIHRETGKKAEIDIVCVTELNSVHIIECKGKLPGGVVSLHEVETWFDKLPVMQDYVAAQGNLSEYHQNYELWTSGTFENDAVARLSEERKKRRKKPIAWRDGIAIRTMAAQHRLKTIGDALNEHFLQHPLTNFK